MKRLVCSFLVISCCFAAMTACRQRTGGVNTADTVVAKPEAVPVNGDSVYKALSKSILASMKSKDYRAVADHIHPDEGVLFSPYGFIDTATCRRFSKASFLALISDSSKAPLNWGRYDGSGLPMDLTWQDYSSRFVYNADFLNAPEFSLNELKSRGNSLNNIDQVFSGHQYTESYFPGFEEKYAGLDWASLRLVFKEKDGRPYLVGIIHDQWTS